MRKYNIGKLNTMYVSSEAVDRDLFAEQKSNVRLYVGKHYTDGTNSVLERAKNKYGVGSETKIRLTQNHIPIIVNTYVNHIVNAAPGAQILPNNESEPQDRKAAKMHSDVKEYITKVSKVDEKIEKLAMDFGILGESFVKIYWNPNKGSTVKGDIVTVVDPITGAVVDEYQEEIISGELEFERVYGFNVLRDPSAKEWDECKYIIIRKMVDRSELLLQYKGTEAEEFIKESGEDTFNVFSGNSTDFQETNKKILIREFYFKPCAEFPNGYFYITTQYGILHEGELPAGIFPIEFCGFNEIPTSPRSYSIIRVARPYQGEINRASSKMAEHQMTVGDDKMVLSGAAKIESGGFKNGVRILKSTGMPGSVEVLPGRTGDQFMPYLEYKINEMYKACNVYGIDEDKITQIDPMALIYRGMRDKKKFSIYAQKFERFVINIWEKSLRLYKFHVLPQALIPAIGKSEMINIDEFKSSDDLSFQIKIKPSSDDVNTVMAKQMAMRDLIQYAGDQVDAGLIARNMPFLNGEEISSEATINYDNAENLIIKLDKGKDMPIRPFDDANYILKRLIHRVRKADFDFLPQEIQMLYQNKIMQYEQLVAEQEQAKFNAQLGNIPISGALIPVQMYENAPNADGTGVKVQRVYMPQDFLEWGRQYLLERGMSEQTIQQYPDQAQVDIQGLMDQQAIPPQSGGYDPNNQF